MKLLGNLTTALEAEYVQFSPCSRFLAHNARHEVFLWNLQTGKVNSLRGHASWVSSIAFSPDGKTLASGSDDRTIKLWDVETGGELATLEGHTSWINGVAFSPDSKLLASGSRDQSITLWDVATKQSIKTLYSPLLIELVAFSPTNRLLSSSQEGLVTIWDMTNHTQMFTFKAHSYSLNTLALFGDTLLTTASYDPYIRLWNLSTRKKLYTLKKNKRMFGAAAFSPDGRIIASPNKRKTITLWNMEDMQTISSVKLKDYAYTVVFSPNGKMLASASRDKTIKLWQLDPL